MLAWIAAIGSVIAAVGSVINRALLRAVEDRHRRQDMILRSYAEMFGRAYRFVMVDDLNDDGKVKVANAQAFTAIAGNVCYLHSGDEAEAWKWYRESQGL
jgi:hypothetical protein